MNPTTSICTTCYSICEPVGGGWQHCTWCKKLWLASASSSTESSGTFSATNSGTWQTVTIINPSASEECPVQEEKKEVDWFAINRMFS